MARLPVLRVVLGLVLASAAAFAQAPRPTHRIETAEQQTVTATMTYEIQTKEFVATRWLAFLPEAPELPSQRNVKTKTEPAGKLVTEKSPLARKMRLIDVPVARPAPGAKLSLKLQVEATLLSRKLVPLGEGEAPPAVAPLTAAERKYYLSPSSLVDFDAAAFKDWLDKRGLERGKSEPPLRFAARVIEALRGTFTYRYDPVEDKRASAACGRDSTDCGGMTHVFVGAMRANDVPARVLVGRLAKPRKPGVGPSDPDYDQPHVRAEVYVGGVGWVPVEATNAATSRGRPVTDFIGNDSGDLLVLHVDVDLRLPFPEQERKAEVLQIGPYYWAYGRGKFDGTYGPTGWDLTTTRPHGK